MIRHETKGQDGAAVLAGCSTKEVEEHPNNLRILKERTPTFETSRKGYGDGSLVSSWRKSMSSFANGRSWLHVFTP